MRLFRDSFANCLCVLYITGQITRNTEEAIDVVWYTREYGLGVFGVGHKGFEWATVVRYERIEAFYAGSQVRARPINRKCCIILELQEVVGLG